MPKYKVLERTFINNAIAEPGAEVEWDGLPSPNLEPLDDAAMAKKGEFEKSDAMRKDRLLRAFPESGIGDPDEFAKKMAEAISAANAHQTDEIIRGVSQGMAQAFAQMFPNGLNKASVLPELAAKDEPESKGSAES